MAEYRVRGPDPDGDYFVVRLDEGEETPLDETYASEDAAMDAIGRLTA